MFDIEKIIGQAAIPGEDVDFVVPPGETVIAHLKALTADDWDALPDKASRAHQLAAQTVTLNGEEVEDPLDVWEKLLAVLPFGEVRHIMTTANVLATARVATPDFSQSASQIPDEKTSVEN